MTNKLIRWTFVIALLFTLNGCFNQAPLGHQPSLLIQPMFNNEVLSCERSFTLLDKDWHYQQLQMYISNVELKDTDGIWQSWPMKVTNYQHSNVALIGENCRDNIVKNDVLNADDKNANWQISFEYTPDLSIMTAIRFTLGVPFSINHLNPISQNSPLNDSSMFWVWQTGHKFLRFEMVSGVENWLFHLGSTGCASPSVMRAPEQACLQPNRVNVELPFNKNSNVIYFDIAQLLKGIKPSNTTICQANPLDENCIKPLENIGVTQMQKVFKSLSHD